MINLHTKPDYEGYEGNAHQEVGIQPTEDNGKDKKFTWNYTSTSFTYTKNKWNVVGRYNFNFSQSDRSNTESTYTNHISHMRENSTAPVRLVNFFRIHNAYFAVDHQINKNHSVSVSYNYSTDASDDYKYASTERLWLDNEEKDTIMKEATRRNSVSRVNSDRHTLGLYYRGRSGAWNYNYDFNYINDGWDSDKNYRQSTGYSSDDYSASTGTMSGLRARSTATSSTTAFTSVWDMTSHGKITSRKTGGREQSRARTPTTATRRGHGCPTASTTTRI